MCDCSGPKELSVYVKGSDRFNWVTPNGEEGSGYIPDFAGLGEYGDYLYIRLCVKCCRLQNIEPKALQDAVAKWEQDDKEAREEEEEESSESSESSESDNE